MYKYFIKPLLWLIPPEPTHTLLIAIGSFLGSNTLTQAITRFIFQPHKDKKPFTAASIVFPNRVGLAAGFDYEARLTGVMPDVGCGFMTVGTITYEPYAGNRQPRLMRLPQSKSILVNKGFKNDGVIPTLKRLGDKPFRIPVGISIGPTNKVFVTIQDEIQDICASLVACEGSQVHHSYYELNISCPNTKNTENFYTPNNLYTLLKAWQDVGPKRPTFIKMPIDFPWHTTKELIDTITPFSCIHGLIFGNLTKDKTNPDVSYRDVTLWQQHAGNLSGKPTWRRSTDLIERTRQTYHDRFILIATGGIFDIHDAQCKMKAGADLVQLITGMIYEGPHLISRVARAIE